ncbi:PREDICTED: uncharacterized protein LOC107074168 [Polistes dominula]|uniref:Uncharacterized protein LOC107074168 n=1 Tax=Polistes dominula TaxID=743375 RepID=A0ABM1JED9_POLDO|nr:PREDICTED: uncharacterized protein LOC107074168 [Polistes dominula]
MGSVSDVYCLLQLILPEIYIYIRDIVLRELPWSGKSNEDEIDDLESKARSNNSKNISPDLIALPCICALLFIILIIFGKVFKNDTSHYPSITNVSIPKDHLPMVYANSRITNSLHSCGDTLFSQEILQSNIPLKLRQSKDLNLPGSSTTKVRSEHSQKSQGTQTSPRVLHKSFEPQEWIVRRTRSGQIYGKYPV